MTDMSKSAISLDKLQAQAPGLVSLAKTAAVSLEKKGLGGHRAAVYLVLDHSGSMQSHYRQGSVQKLTEQALGLSVNLDDDGRVPVIYFSDDAHRTNDALLTHYQGIIDRTHAEQPWGFTNYADAINTVVDLHLRTAAPDPGLVLFQTDGNPYTRHGDAASAAVKALKDASPHPLFFSFIGFGSEMQFLRRLDTLRVGIGGRKVDNASLFETGHDPRRISDADLYDGITHEYPKWLNDARAKGIIR